MFAGTRQTARAALRVGSVAVAVSLCPRIFVNRDTIVLAVLPTINSMTVWRVICVRPAAQLLFHVVRVTTKIRRDSGAAPFAPLGTTVTTAPAPWWTTNHTGVSRAIIVHRAQNTATSTSARPGRLITRLAMMTSRTVETALAGLPAMTGDSLYPTSFAAQGTSVDLELTWPRLDWVSMLTSVHQDTIAQKVFIDYLL